MSEQYLHECVCGRQHRSSVPAAPPGWLIVEGKPICDDCASATLCGPCSTRPEMVEAGGCAPPIAAASARSPYAILLRSGSYLDLSDPDCSVIEPIDIAAGLRQGRFSGQTPQFYTIAQHSVLVMEILRPLARTLGGARGEQLLRCGLMHDAAEAFIHDITRPLKILLPDYRRVEAVLETRIARRFGIEWTANRHQQVKRADLIALAIEKRDLLGITDPWPVVADIESQELAHHRITRAWHPDEAQDAFLAAFRMLGLDAGVRRAA